MGHAVLVDPYLILISSQPRRIGVNRVALHEERWRCGLIPYLEIEPVLTGGNLKLLRLAKLQLAVEHEIEAAFGSNHDGFSMSQVDHRGKFHRGPG